MRPNSASISKHVKLTSKLNLKLINEGHILKLPAEGAFF